MQAKLVIFISVVGVIALCYGNPVQNTNNNNGKYEVSEQKNNDGKYHAQDDGRYHPNPNQEGRSGSYDSLGRYIHVHDNRELGFYKHIPYPYDGGYGPYSGSNLPYVHDDRPYNHDLYTSTTTKKPTTTTKRTTTTTTTTTTTPRTVLFNYDDEGRNKILHQEDLRKKDKYDHAYLTENGIYGEEQAKLHHAGGTHAKGYYEYTGDDGKLYRVNYKSTHEGFVPEGEHIPTPPPIPEAIARALKYVEEKRKANGDNPEFDHRGFRIDQMPKDVKAKIKAFHAETMPKEIADKIRMLQHEVELEEEEEKKKQIKTKTIKSKLSHPTRAPKTEYYTTDATTDYTVRP